MRGWPSHKADFKLPMRYLHRGQGPGAVILLHGYQDHALSFVRRMGWLEAHDLPFQILAVNAPFPVPIWTANGFIEAYSWYFRDTSRDLMIVHPADSAAHVAALVSGIFAHDTPKVILGFSQGGIMGAHLAPKLPGTRAIIAVGSGYPEDVYHTLDRKIKVFGIHGDVDDRWPLDKSQPAHDRLMDLGFSGDFHLVPGLGHRADRSIESLVRKLAVSAMKGS